MGVRGVSLVEKRTDDAQQQTHGTMNLCQETLGTSIQSIIIPVSLRQTPLLLRPTAKKPVLQTMVSTGKAIIAPRVVANIDAQRRLVNSIMEKLEYLGRCLRHAVGVFRR